MDHSSSNDGDEYDTDSTESATTDLDMTLCYENELLDEREIDCSDSEIRDVVTEIVAEIVTKIVAIPAKPRGSNRHCCWGQCKTDSRKLPDDSPIYFIPFPKEGKFKEGMSLKSRRKQEARTEKAKQWVHLCGRAGFTLDKITRNTYICSLHFIGGKGPTEENPNPIKANLLPSEMSKLGRKRKPPAVRSSETITKRKYSSTVPVTPETKTVPAEPMNDTSDIQFEISKVTEYESTSTDNSVGHMLKDVGTQTMYDKFILGARIETMIMKNEMKTQLTRSSTTSSNIICSKYGQMEISSILKSGKKTKYFTGLDPGQFWMLYDWLGDAKDHIRYWNASKTGTKNPTKKDFSPQRKFTKSEELFLTLLRLRRGMNVQTLAYIYDSSETLIRNIFKTWIMFLYCHFKDYKHLMFPSRENLRQSIPKVFRKFKNIRASIDCTEFFCEMPQNFAQQGNIFSSYKHHCTFKCLIAVNPSGGACFVSDLYEGSMDDVKLFETCGILNHVNPGDSFLVDKGFTVQHLLLPKKASVFIPPFLGSRETFTKEEVILNQRIAKARIHVERFNERLKKFRLVSGTIPLNLSPIASQMVYVACCLVNFQPCLCR
jgi:hypothetical protein